MVKLRFHLFGKRRVVREGRDQEQTLAVRPAGWSLLAYLLLFRERAHSRERLTDLFWRGQKKEKARHCLRTTLWRLRQALEPVGCISTGDEGQLQFDRTERCWLDVADFEAQVSMGLDLPLEAMTPATAKCLEEACRLYTGDLLPGCYEEWAVRERERLRLLYLKAQERLMCYYQERQQYEQALACGRQILARDPLREGVHQQMIALYLASGQRARAVEQYNRCQAVLAEELQIAPMAETQRLLAEALNTVAQEPAAEAPPLCEAMQQISQATQLLRETAEQLELAVGLISQHVGEKEPEVADER